MILRKKIWRVILILLVVSIGVVSIIFIFHSFKIKPHRNNKDKEQSEQTKRKEQKNGDFRDFIKAVDSFVNSFDYRPIQPTQKEPEYQGETLPISSVRAEYKKELVRKSMLPQGSAIFTSAGDLEKIGIKGIIHLATRSIDLKNKEFQPTVQNFIRSIQRAIILVEEKGYKNIAFPLVDNEFLDLILPPEQSSKSERKHELARMIIIAALSQSKNLERIIFVGLGGEFAVEITKITENKHYQNNIENIKKINELSGMYLTSGKGITDYSEHKCEVVVNTTFNVEGKFIGSRGLSGFICQRTGSGKNQIQKEIKECISEFNKRLKK